MSTANWIYLGIGLFVLALTSLVGWWNKRRPNRDKKVKEALRQPKIIAVIGWLVLLIGLLFLPMSFSGSLKDGDNVPMLVCGIVLFLTGAFLVAIYANWYVIIRKEEIILRTAFRKIRHIRYENIDKFLLARRGVVPMLKIWGTDGAVIELNSQAFDVSPVLAAIELRHGQTMGQAPGA